jgi:hypothetical protein
MTTPRLQMPQPPQEAIIAAPPSTGKAWQKSTICVPGGATALHQATHGIFELASEPPSGVPASLSQGISTVQLQTEAGQGSE